MRDEKEERKKQARSNKQTNKQGKATQHTQGSTFNYAGTNTNVCITSGVCMDGRVRSTETLVIRSVCHSRKLNIISCM